MKLLYDIGVLGVSKTHKSCRTGIFRVVYELLTALQRSEAVQKKEFSLDLFSAHPAAEVKAYEYLQDDPVLAQLPFIQSKYCRYVTQNPQIQKLIDELTYLKRSHFDAKNNKKLLELSQSMVRLELFRMVHRQTMNIVKQLEAPNYIFDQKRPYDIAHFLFSQHINNDYELPAEVKHRFVTLYDMTPIVCSTYNQNNTSVTRENHIKSTALLNERDTILCISEHTKQDLLNYRSDLKEAQCKVTYLGAAEHFHPVSDESLIQAIRRKFKLDSDTPYFLSLCTLAPHKNLPFVINSFLNFIEAERIPDLKLVLTGAEGWGYEEIYSLFKKRPQLKDRLVFTGYVDDSDLAPLYSGALGFVYASLYEGFGLPILEAMQCGVPVISSNTSSMPEVGGDAVLYTNPTDADQLAGLFSRLYKDAALRHELKQKSLQRAQAFSWAHCAEQTLDAYRSVLGSTNLLTV